MDLTEIINCCFGWFLVTLAVIGYFITYKIRGEKWVSWHVLALGWAFFAMTQTLMIANIDTATNIMIAIWLCSYVFVASSMILLFLKLLRLKNKKLR